MFFVVDVKKLVLGCTTSPLCNFLSIVLSTPFSPFPSDVPFKWPHKKKVKKKLKKLKKTKKKS